MKRTRTAKTAGGRRGRLGVAVLLVALCLGAIATSASAAANPVLGAKAFAAPYGSGWGNPTAIGYGLNPIFKPHGGYYRKPARIELRATALGRCGMRAAYTKLEVRIPKKPGGKLGKWFSWSGAKTICKSPF